MNAMITVGFCVYEGEKKVMHNTMFPDSRIMFTHIFVAAHEDCLGLGGTHYLYYQCAPSALF